MTEPEQHHVGGLERSFSDIQLDAPSTSLKRKEKISKVIVFYVPALEDLQTAIQSQGASHIFCMLFAGFAIYPW